MVLKLMFVTRVRPAPGGHPPRWAAAPGVGGGSTEEGVHNSERWGGSLKEGGWPLKTRQTKMGRSLSGGLTEYENVGSLGRGQSG